MKEYKIKITGEYDVLVLSPKMIAGLIDKIRGSDTREIVIPAEEIFPQGYEEYLNRVLEANAEVARTKTGRKSVFCWNICKTQKHRPRDAVRSLSGQKKSRGLKGDKLLSKLRLFLG